MCITACHLTKVLILLIKSTVSFVKRTIALSPERLGPIRFNFTVSTYTLYMHSNMLQFLSSSFSPLCSALPLICRCESYHTALHPISFSQLHCLLIPSLTPPRSFALAAQSEILDDWDELCDWSHSLTGYVLMQNITCDSWLRCLF